MSIHGTRKTISRHGAIVAGIITLLLFVGGVTSGFASGVAEEESELTIVTTTGHIGDAVRRIAPDANVTVLMGPGSDPHTYVPGTRETQRMRQADLVLYNGLRLEIQFADQLEGLGEHALPVAGFVPEEKLIPAEGHDDGHGHHDDHGHDHDHGEYDPHIWFDLDLWAEVVRGTAKVIAEIDPAMEEVYRANAEDYINELQELDDYARRRVAELGDERPTLVTNHDAFAYLARAYGFDGQSVFGISTDQEAAVRDIERLADYVIEHEVPVVFQEEIVGTQAIDALAEAVEAGGGIIHVHTERLYSGALGEEGDVSTFSGAFRHNIDTIVDAFLTSMR